MQKKIVPKDIHDFFEFYTSERFHKVKFVTKEDIDKANSDIDEVLLILND